MRTWPTLNSEAPAATQPSPTEIPPSVVTEVGCQSPYAGGGGRQQPEADFLKCRSGPKWQRRAAAGNGHAACHLTPFALARTSDWRPSAFGIPKQTSNATSKVPRL